MSAMLAYQSSVGQDPQIAVPVCSSLIDPFPCEQGILMVMKTVAVETVQTVRSAEPYIPVLFLIDAVDGGGQSFITRYLSIYESFLCCDLTYGGQEKDQGKEQSSHGLCFSDIQTYAKIFSIMSKKL